MNSIVSSRYKLIENIGQGDFATTYSARDTKLDRDVAIKQLHKQYLDDDAKLSRYWREAQLLASLEHPNNMTIYDVDRRKGRLVLELMQGSLRQIYCDKPMPVEDVRQTLIQGLNGLQCLHDNGILHSDVSPQNLFLSRQDVVKLGDFGLARRIEDDEGSLLKGNAQYIAPELVSRDFGDVGPASDLYSFGFSALELLVGPEFETLFPDLIAFGRDRKMAWMMWHCAADRRIPPISSILEGVPQDLAHVITRLTTKDQRLRYRSAADALQELNSNPTPVGRSLKEEAEREAAEAKRKKSRMRRIAAASWMVSIAASCAIWWYSMDPPPAPAREVPPAVEGVVKNVLPLDQKLVLDLGKDWKELTLAKDDVVLLNRKGRQLRDLEPGDRVVVHTRLDPEEKDHLEIVAFRPETHSGVIESILKAEKTFVLSVTDGEDLGSSFKLSVPENTPVEINKLTELQGSRFSFHSLAVGDEVVVHHSDDESGMLALSVKALRQVKKKGFIREVSLRQRVVTISLQEDEQNETSFVRFPLHSDCVFTLNGLDTLNSKLLTLNDLKPGDKVTVSHDAKASVIDAYREFQTTGKITDLQFQKKKLKLNDRWFRISHESKIWLSGKPASLDDLRRDDVLSVSHDSPGDQVPVLDRITADRPPHANKWAILIANGKFSDRKIPSMANATENANRLRETMISRYAIPPSQAMICEDFDRTRLEQEIPVWLAKIPDDAELFVYVKTHAGIHDGEDVLLASSDTVLEQVESSGWRLDWLIDRLDSMGVTRKVLMLDCSFKNLKDLGQPAVPPGDLIKALRSSRRGGYPRSLYVLGSQSAEVTTQSDPGHFAKTLTSGFAGQADLERDNEIQITELAEYAVRKSRQINGMGTPELILPDPNPPRITASGRTEILELLAHTEDTRFRRVEEEAMLPEVEALTQRLGGEQDAQLAFAIVLIKHNRFVSATKVLEELRLREPECLQVHRVLAWLHFRKDRFNSGMTKLTELLELIPSIEKMPKGFEPETLELFSWIGGLRQLAESQDWSKRKPDADSLSQFDEKVKVFGDDAEKRFEQGRNRVNVILGAFAKKIAAGDEAAGRERRRFFHYFGLFPHEAEIALLTKRLDRQDFSARIK